MPTPRFALSRTGRNGFLVIEGPDDHLTTVEHHHQAWTFGCLETATRAAQTLTRLTGNPVTVVPLG
jgi:hypothetical protein